MESCTRREFAKGTLASLATYSLLETLFQEQAFGKEVKPLVARWVADLDQLGREVKGQKLKQTDWQTKVEQLFAKVDLPELLRFVDFDRLSKNANFVDNGARSLRFRFPEVEGLPKKMVFGKQIFALKKDRSVVPHGHNKMATAFLILKGDLQGRHYDRLEDRPEHIVIRPTIDRKFSPGGYSTVSDHKDNVHWFQALTEPAFIFNIHVLNVNPDSKLSTGRVYLDPKGKDLGGGKILARRINSREAHELYG